MNKEKRLEEAKRLKENWKRRETEEDYDIDEETEEPEDLMKEDTAQKSPQETAQMKEEEEKNTDKDEKQKQAVIPEASLVNEKEGEEGKEEETEEEGEINQVGLFDYLGIEEEVNSLCFVCIMSPCICILANIEKQMKRILEKEDEKKVEQPEIGRKKRKRETEEEEGTPQKQYKESVQMRTLPLYLVGEGHTEITKKGVITVCPSMGAETTKDNKKTETIEAETMGKKTGLKTRTAVPNIETRTRTENGKRKSVLDMIQTFDKKKETNQIETNQHRNQFNPKIKIINPPKLQVETSARNETSNTNKTQTSKKGQEIVLTTNKTPPKPKTKQRTTSKHKKNETTTTPNTRKLPSIEKYLTRKEQKPGEITEKDKKTLPTQQEKEQIKIKPKIAKPKLVSLENKPENHAENQETKPQEQVRQDNKPVEKKLDLKPPDNTKPTQEKPNLDHLKKGQKTTNIVTPEPKPNIVTRKVEHENHPSKTRPTKNVKVIKDLKTLREFLAIKRLEREGKSLKITEQNQNENILAAPNINTSEGGGK